MSFKVIETQAELDAIIQDRLKRQKETIETQYTDYADIKKRNETLEAEIGALSETLKEVNEKASGYDQSISDLQKEISGYKTSEMRTKIALAHGIPYDLAARLVGEDEESIAADAKNLAGLVGQGSTIPPLKNTEPNLDDKDGAYKSLLENLNLEGE